MASADPFLIPFSLFISQKMGLRGWKMELLPELFQFQCLSHYVVILLSKPQSSDLLHPL